MRAVDLFCGAAGGWSIGWHAAGFQTVAACEIDPMRRQAFANNNPGVVMYDDIRRLSATRLRRDLGFLPEAIIGSPPCQDASTANPKGKGIEGERTGLFTEYVRLVREIRPRWLCAENVPGFRTRGADWLLDALEAIGYACWPLVVGAIHAGAPHKRSRVWFIAADAAQVGRREGRARRSAVGAQWARHEGGAPIQHDPDANQEGESDVPVDGEMGWQLGVPSDADETGLAIGKGERGDARQELAALERAVGPAGMLWHGGPASHFRVADGVPRRVALDCISMYGDAVVPRITQAIANAIRRTEQLMEGA